MFYKNVKQIMQEREITQADLMRLTGIGKTSISQYLSGKNEPSKRRKIQIAEALGVTLEDLEKPIPRTVGRKFRPEDAAHLLGCDADTIRLDIQNGTCQFGHGVQTSSRWTYIMYPKKFTEITGIELED